MNICPRLSWARSWLRSRASPRERRKERSFPSHPDHYIRDHHVCKQFSKLRIQSPRVRRRERSFLRSLYPWPSWLITIVKQTIFQIKNSKPKGEAEGEVAIHDPDFRFHFIFYFERFCLSMTIFISYFTLVLSFNRLRFNLIPQYERELDF